ncbi:hypothetical protein D049_1251A, partial [Vibrio parahaemolyticus VPTS-2010]
MSPRKLACDLQTNTVRA